MGGTLYKSLYTGITLRVQRLSETILYSKLGKVKKRGQELERSDIQTSKRRKEAIELL